MVGLIRTLSLAMILTSFVAVESRSLRRAITAYMAQALIMVAVIGCFATLHPFRALRGGDDAEVPARTGPLLSAVVVGSLAVASYQFVHHHVGFLAPTAEAQVEPFRTNIAVALTLVAVGIYAIVTRRDALKIVIGVCLIENGAHLSLVTLATRMHETVLVGIVTDVVVAVFLLLYIIRGAVERLGTRDTTRLAELRG